MKRLLFYILLSYLLSGCEAKHLAYVHETTLGIDVAASADTGTGRFVLGYDSDTYAIVPRKGTGQDAMSLTSMGCISASGLDQVTFNHFVSSGEAAKKIAQNEEILRKINMSIQSGGKSCEPSNSK